MSAPFCGKAVVIARSSGPPGSGSLTMFSARAVTGARVAAPAAPRKRRRVDRDGAENRLSMLGLQMRSAESNRSVGYFTSMCTPDGTGGDDAIDGSNNAFGTAKFLLPLISDRAAYSRR